MKVTLPVLLALTSIASTAWSQTSSPSSAAPPARTDLYHVHFAKAATGKAAELGEEMKKQDPNAPMPGHFIVFRHMEGDSWDYCVIEHLGTKATVDAGRARTPNSQTGLGDWHTDTFAAGPSWAEFTKQMGIDDASKTIASAFVVSMYRPVPGQRDALDKMLGAAPDRATDTSSGNVLLQHEEGAAWTFVSVARYNSWNDFAKSEVNSVGQMSKKDSGWYQLRSLVSFHTDTLCDRLSP